MADVAPGTLVVVQDELRPTKCLRMGLRMEMGDGEGSYSRNSELQGGILRDTGHDLTEAISQLISLPEDGPIRVADFGCSVGANALAWADLAASSVLKNFQPKANANSPEILHYFNDLPSNDFNSLFLKLVEDGKGERRPYFAAAVGGSFHERLFPRGSLHIAISTWSLHWMSKIPDAVLDVSSPAYNKGRVWIDGGNPVVAEAYAEVGRQDLLNFFTHRACELAPAGLLFLMCPCRAEPGKPESQSSGEFQKANPVGGIFEDSWEDLVAEGVIKPEERNAFNAPVFHPSLAEIEAAINETCAYDIKRLEIRRDHQWLAPGSQQAQHFRANPASFGLWAKNFARAIYNPLVEAHLGPPRALRLWERLEHNTTVSVQRTKNICLSMPGANYALVVLSRKTQPTVI